MRRIVFRGIASFAGTAAICAMGCTNLHQAGNIVGLGKQAHLAPASDSLAGPPTPPVDAESYPPSLSYADASAPGSAYSDPSCDAPFLREPTCASPTWNEPSCAGPRTSGGYGAAPGMGARDSYPAGSSCGPCRCAACVTPPVQEPTPAPQPPEPHGCLTFGGGHLSIPLPTIQFPGFFRVPAYRQALVPVAEATYVGVPAPTQVAATPVVPVAAVPVAPAPLAVVPQQAVPLQAPVEPLESPADVSCEIECLCKEDLEALRRLARMANSQADAAPAQPTPAAGVASQSQAEIDALRSQVRQYQEDIDTIIRDLKSQTDK